MAITNGSQLLATGLEMLEAGFSLVPIDRATKRPFWRLLPYLFDAQGAPVMKTGRDRDTGVEYTFHARGWAPYQTTPPTAAELERWVKAGAQLAVVCGAVSGGLMVLDFDEDGFYERWVAAMRAAGYGYVLDELPVQRTGGGGYQVFLRCAEPGENMKLAWRLTGERDAQGREKRLVAIETRGEGGYAVIAPSLHPSGNYYTLLGDLAFADTPTLEPQSAVERFLELARGLSDAVDAAEHAPTPRRTDLADDARLIDRYNDEVDIGDVLERYGYTWAGPRMHRPGYERTSQPSVEIYADDNASFHFSSNDPLSDGHRKKPFAVYCYYEHGGNVKAAVRALAERYGVAYEQFEPVMHDGFACCPHHPAVRLREGRKSGYFCPARDGEGYCGYYWRGEGYTPPYALVATRRTSVTRADIRALAAQL